jgi:hypothetical protein
LVFLTQRINTKASNWDFAKKKKEYFASSDGSSPFVITQAVLQTEKWTPEHLEARQAQLTKRLSEIWRLNPPEHIEQPVEPDNEAKGWQFTDSKLIEAKRAEIMHTFCVREKVTLTQKKALYRSPDDSLHVICTVSKRYAKNRPAYWYGYDPDWRKFLSEASQAFLILGCMDRNAAFVIPFKELEKLLPELYRTPPDKHWHINVHEDVSGVHLLTKQGKKISLVNREMPVEKISPIGNV